MARGPSGMGSLPGTAGRLRPRGLLDHRHGAAVRCRHIERAIDRIPLPRRPPRPGPSPTPPTSRDFTVGGDRPVTVHVPPAYASDTPAPLLILLHGYGASGAEQESYWRLGPVAAEAGMLYAYPDGSPDVDGARFWNGTDACCDFHGSGVDDSGYLAGLVSQIKAKANVDPRRVYFVGHSNGAFMSYRVACDHADEVAAIVSLAGATFGTPAKCAPSSPVAVLEIHGTADDTVLFGGGNLGELFAGSTGRRLSGSQGVRRNLGCVRRLRDHRRRDARDARSRCRSRRTDRPRRDHDRRLLDRLPTRRPCGAVDDGRRLTCPRSVARLRWRCRRLPAGPPQAIDSWPGAPGWGKRSWMSRSRRVTGRSDCRHG